MHHDPHVLDTSHTRVSGDRVKTDEWTNNREEPPLRPWQPFYSKRSCDQCICSTVTSHFDVTVPFNDVTLANKMMHFRHTVSKTPPPKIA